MAGSAREAGLPAVRSTSIALGGLLAACLHMGPANAAGVCEQIPQSPPSYASRIAAVACAENSLWYSPFIDAQGRLASMSVAETERVRLQDGETLAWQRVAEYWKGSGLLAQMSYFPGASDCSHGDTQHLPAASCRAFLADTPWSAAFVSFVMSRAGVPGFNASPSHIDFLREAYGNPGFPYVLSDPDATAPGTGDLLCFRRGGSPIGPQGLRQLLAHGSAGGMNMHCDIVVAASPAGDGKAYLVGGNVLQGVTMRILPLNRNGMVWGLPRRTSSATDCHPGNEAACNFNRQDWVALLKLKPLPAPGAALPLPGSEPRQCCTRCPLPMPATMKRCPVLQRPVDMPPGPGQQ